MKTKNLHNLTGRLSGFTMLVVALLFTVSVRAADRYSVATGLYSSTGTWSATSGGEPGASVPVATDNVFIEGGFTVTQSSSASCSNLSVNGASTFVQGGASFVINGNLTILGGSTFSTASNNLTVSGTITAGGETSGTFIFTGGSGAKIFTGLVTINANGTWNNTQGRDVNFGGGITNYGTFTAGAGNNNFDTNPQSLIGTFSIPNLKVTGVTLTNNGNVTVSTSLTGTGTFTNGVNATLNFGDGSVPSINTLTATAPGNTVNYYRAGNQTVKQTSYYNLTFSGSGTKTLGSSTTIGGALRIEGSALAGLANGTSSTANALYFLGAAQIPGSWGHTSSSAQNKNAVYFSNNTGIVTVAGGWLGATSTDWNVATNWFNNVIPAAATNVYIPSAALNQPHITQVPAAPAVCNNLTISTGASVTIDPGKALTVFGNIANSAGVNGLVIKSDATGTGSLIHSNADVHATVERYITAAAWGVGTNGWHLLASPVESQLINGTWTPTGTGNDYDFYAFDETKTLPSEYWRNQKISTNGITSFLYGKGYLVAYQQTDTKTFSGELNYTPTAISLSYTSTSPNDGWNLLANPYASGLTWGTWATSNTNLAGSAKIILSNDGSYDDIGIGEIIPAMNGFFVRTSAATTLTIPTTARTHGGTWHKSGESISKITLIAHDLDGGTAQRSHIRLVPDATDGYDRLYDSEFRPFNAPQFYSVAGDLQLSTNALPGMNNETVIPFGFVKNGATNFSIELAESIPGYEIILEDLKTGAVHNFAAKGPYTFTSETDDDPDRFVIRGPMVDAAGDYRTRATGNWNGTTTWQRYDGATWVDVTTPPTSADGVITILSGHVVTNTTNLPATGAIDQVFVATGGTLKTTAVMTIANGIGDDLTIDGTFEIAGGKMTLGASSTVQVNSLLLATGSGDSFDFGANSSLIFNGTSTLRWNRNGGSLPIVARTTWLGESTCEITGMEGSGPGNDNQNYQNLIWDCALQTGNHNFSAGYPNTAKDFILKNTGTAMVQFGLTGNGVNNIGRNLVIEGGILQATTGGVRTINVAGNFVMSGGEFRMSAGSDVCTVNLSGDYTHTAGLITETSTGSGAFIFKKAGVQTFTSGGTVSNTINYTVNSGSTLQMAAEGTVVSGNAFTLSSGATLGIRSAAGITASGATGNVQTTTRTFNSGASYIYNGTVAQVTGNGLPATVANLSINNPTGVTLSAPLTVSGTLSNTVASGLIIPSGGSLLHSTTGVPATVERYIAAANWADATTGWHLVASPVASQNIDGLWTPTGDGNAYDFFALDETRTNGYWLNQKIGANGITSFIPGNGYLVAYQQAGTKTFTSNLNVSNITFTNLSLTPAGGYPGWHLLGNPFATALKWNDGNWALTNVAGSAKIWDEANKSYTDIGANGIIPSAQGFMVQVQNVSNSLTIPATSRVHSATPWYKSEGDVQRILLLASETEGGSKQLSQLIVNPLASASYDFENDLRFLPGHAPQFYSITGDEKLSTNSVPTLQGGIVVPFGFVKNTASSFSIEMQESIEGQLVFLTDLKTGTVTNLSQTPLYNFSSAAGDDVNRFLLNFGTLGIEDPQAEVVNIYAFGGILYMNDVAARSEITVTNLLGQVVQRDKADGSSLTTLNVQALPKGVYVVSVTGNGQSISRKVIL